MAYYSLVASSTLFLVPTLYGLYRGHRLLPVVSIITTAASISYWLDPTSVEKRGIDMVVSKTCGVIYVVYGWYNIMSPSMRMCGYVNVLGMMSAYQMSCLLYPGPYWLPYHILFHYLATFTKIVIIYSS